MSATCVPGYSWMFNSLNQSPCDVAAALGGVCIGGGFGLQALPPGYVYQGPTVSQANPCRCNSVIYSLVAACSACQSRDYKRWSQYTANCTAIYPEDFPRPIPNGIAVPHYAYLDVETTDIFDINAAQAAGGPESTRAPIPTSSASSSASAVPSAKKNVPAIAGGVVGGVVGLVLIAGFVFWLLRRRAKTRPASSASYDMDPRKPTSLGGSTSPADKDTNAPSTFPPSSPSSYTSGHTLPYAPFPGLQQQNQPKQPSHISPNGTGTTAPSSVPSYRGAPEI